MRRAAVWIVALALLACEPQGPRGEPGVPAPSSPPGAPAQGAGLPAPSLEEPSSGLRSLDLQMLGGRRVRMTGTAPAGAPTVEVSVEDGHNILYGPETVPVQPDGRFTVELEVAPSEIQRVYAYLTTPDGAELVLPIQMPTPGQ